MSTESEYIIKFTQFAKQDCIQQAGIVLEFEYAEDYNLVAAHCLPKKVEAESLH